VCAPKPSISLAWQRSFNRCANPEQGKKARGSPAGLGLAATTVSSIFGNMAIRDASIDGLHRYR
jgi:hypothetical protein